MKAVSVSAELLALERVVQLIADRLDVTKLDDPLTDEAQRQLVSALTMVAVRLRDLGRTARGRLPVEHFWAPHNDADPSNDQEDVILYEVAPATRKRR